ncbi:hypothetical protein [Sphingopyxis panaciterrae]
MNWISRLFGNAGGGEDDPIIPVPFPPLITLLQQRETAKGSALTEVEVLDIRDAAVCMTMKRSRAEQLAASRGFPDIDPANAWEEWLHARPKSSD